MIVLSLFDGISCARLALQKANILVKEYYASEIDKYASKISQSNFPDHKQLGNVKDVKPFKVDLLIGGSPCQDLSIAKKDRKGLEGERSSLFWEYVRCLNECKPKYFIFENVASMKQEDKETISKALNVEPIMINAALVSAQSRKRLFWTNISNVVLPEDKGIKLKNILEENVDEKYFVKNKILTSNEKYKTLIGHIGNSNSQGNRVYSIESKSICLSANGGGLGAKTGLYKIGNNIRKLTPIECERLQGVPDNYTKYVSDTQRYKCLGNAFNVDIMAHILSFIPK